MLTAIPRPPAIPASLAALVMLAGLGLVYWSLSSFGAFVPLTGSSAPAGSSLPSGGGFGGGSSGTTPGQPAGTSGGAGGGF